MAPPARPARRLPRPTRLLSSALAALLGAGAWAAAADWPQYRGPNHDGTTAETVTPWKGEKPKETWRVKVGGGFGSFAVAGKGAYLFEERNLKEVCVKRDADTGKELWAADIDRTTTNTDGGPFPRSTPAVDGDRVYVLGSFLKLVCLNAADGKVAWQHDLMKEFGGRNITWDNAASPVVDGDKVFVAGGGKDQSLIAFDKATGAVAWKTGDEKMTHASPVPATIHGVRQVIFFTQSGLVSVNPADGATLWKFPVQYHVSTASDPIVGGKDGEFVYCSAGYGTGSAACRVTKDGDTFKAVELWRTPDKGENVNHWTTPVYHDGTIYGIFGFKSWGKAPLKAVPLGPDAPTDAWAHPGFGSGGGTVLAGNLLVVQSDTGRLVLVEATPAGYKEVAAAPVLRADPPLGPGPKNQQRDLQKCWTMAVVANGHIFARSTHEAVCLDVSGK